MYGKELHPGKQGDANSKSMLSDIADEPSTCVSTQI